MSFQHIIDTPLGWMQFRGTREHIQSACWLEEEDAVIGMANIDVEWRETIEEQINDYFKGSRKYFSVPTMPLGSDFQVEVWKELQQLHHGETTSYSELAEKLGDKNKSRAVGTAIGANPLLLLIPCHRVIGSDGDLTGYAGGLNRKQWLLEHEGAFSNTQLRLF